MGSTTDEVAHLKDLCHIILPTDGWILTICVVVLHWLLFGFNFVALDVKLVLKQLCNNINKKGGEGSGTPKQELIDPR